MTLKDTGHGPLENLGVFVRTHRFSTGLTIFMRYIFSLREFPCESLSVSIRGDFLKVGW